jgi:hypothetical protein
MIMKKYVILLFTLILVFSFLLTGCSKYVCYDGSVQKDAKKCPIIKVAEVVELDAGRYADNYGMAVAQAKRQSYTRVNMYVKDASWYANVLFTDAVSGDINKVLLKIDGKTGDVSCVTGCEYFNPVVAPETMPVETSPTETSI